ncbi:MAG: hypothetical protein VB010_04690 [Sphaerochaeta associata]|jgi:hypothetical protein|uniref:hypothetical protein n=1 Tax=Sphaerochaeta associata TaxID=1129264 RepID=UPI002B20030A|nr:hypothetical protein [Sphaerochaeta associata]MEA5106631.1 hypothetical protein [Sphaerochaeta associata]
MYYLLTYRTRRCLFATADDAFHCLQAWQQWAEAHTCNLVDYLLLPHCLQLVLQGRIQVYRTKTLVIQQLTDEELLASLARLGMHGRNYPFCGTYELYHASNCYAALGKAGFYALPYPLSVILKAKKNQSSKRARTVDCDEIA